MANKSLSAIPRLFRISFILSASVNLFARQATAQKTSSGEGELSRALYVCCLKEKFPHMEISKIPGHTAYDPDSHRNFAWDKDKQVWIDTKTLEFGCPNGTPSRTAQQQTPSTKSKVKNVLKTIGSSVIIGIGGGIGAADTIIMIACVAKIGPERLTRFAPTTNRTLPAHLTRTPAKP